MSFYTSYEADAFLGDRIRRFGMIVKSKKKREKNKRDKYVD